MLQEPFRTRFLRAFERSGLKIQELSERSGVSVDVIKKLKTRPTASTSADNAEKLMAVLVGTSEVAETTFSAFIQHAKSEDEERLLKMFRRLDEDEKTRVLKYVRAIFDFDQNS